MVLLTPIAITKDNLNEAERIGEVQVARLPIAVRTPCEQLVAGSLSPQSTSDGPHATLSPQGAVALRRAAMPT